MVQLRHGGGLDQEGCVDNCDRWELLDTRVF